MATSFIGAAAQHQTNNGALPLLGEVRRTQHPRNDVASPWLVELLAKTLTGEFSLKEIAFFFDTDKGNASRILANKQAMDVRRMDARMNDDERDRFGRALHDTLRKAFGMEDDARRLTRALDALAASVNVIGEIARKALR